MKLFITASSKNGSNLSDFQQLFSNTVLFNFSPVIPVNAGLCHSRAGGNPVFLFLPLSVLLALPPEKQKLLYVPIGYPPESSKKGPMPTEGTGTL